MTGTELVHQVAAEYGQTLADEVADAILWRFTGWPHFFKGDPEAHFRGQLREYFADPAGVEARMERAYEEASAEWNKAP